MRHSADEIRTLLSRLDKQKASELESETLEFKEWSREWEQGEAGRRKFYRLLAEYAVCFANHKGGTLVIGVREKAKGRAQAIVGCGVYHMPELRARIYDLTDPHILVESEELLIDDLGARLLLIHIPQGVGIHTTTDGVAKVRVGTECKPMTGTMRQQRLIEAGLIDFTDAPLPCSVKEAFDPLEVARLKRLIEARKPGSPLLRLQPEQLKDLPEETYREALLNAVQHRDYCSQSAVFVKHYPDRLEISNPGSFLAGITPDNILRQDSHPRNRRLTEALRRIGLVERAGVGVQRMFYAQLSSGKPPPNYSTSGASVRVTLYDGSLDESFTRFVRQREREGQSLGLDELLILFALRRQRELSLAEATRTLQLNLDRVRAILLQMLRKGLLERSGARGTQLFRLSGTVYQQLGESIAYIREAGIDALRYEELILSYVRQFGAINNRITRELLGVDVNAAKRLLTKPHSEGKLTRIGKRRGAYYVLPD